MVVSDTAGYGMSEDGEEDQVLRQHPDYQAFLAYVQSGGGRGPGGEAGGREVEMETKEEDQRLYDAYVSLPEWWLRQREQQVGTVDQGLGERGTGVGKDTAGTTIKGAGGVKRREEAYAMWLRTGKFRVRPRNRRLVH